MIVYGDPGFQESAHFLVERLCVQVAALQSTTSPPLDSLRALLITTGQLEQAVHDAAMGFQLTGYESLLFQVEHATTRAALAFYAQWSSGEEEALQLSVSCAEALATLASTLNAMCDLPVQPLTVKVPEGFAFYSLYPEQYCVAAHSWMNVYDDESRGEVLVVGVRSIGTSLSALVLASLLNSGWTARRVTVRPTGHPFERNVELDIGPHDLRTSALRTRALIVDEGPGISGSSMASVAEALVRCGIERERIAFLPGHGGEPGYAASERTRQWWDSAPRYVASYSDLRWQGRSICQLLAHTTERICKDEVQSFEDMGGGLWRRIVYENGESWPAVCAPFERAKYLCTTRGGQRVLWKFAGFSPEGATSHQFQQLAVRHQSGWTGAPLDYVAGFMATRWIDGTALAKHDVNAETLQHIARYVVHVAGEPLTVDEEEAAIARLQEMLYWNTHEALGEAAARRLKSWLHANTDFAADSRPRYGDGRMAPHEWIRTHDPALVKVGSVGHDMDHTVVGPQTWMWDAAGTISEWNLSEEDGALFLRQLASEGLFAPVSTLPFYRMAYAAFRLGQCTLCAQMSTHDSQEQQRLWGAVTLYTTQLSSLLEHATS